MYLLYSRIGLSMGTAYHRSIPKERQCAAGTLCEAHLDFCHAVWYDEQENSVDQGVQPTQKENADVEADTGTWLRP